MLRRTDRDGTIAVVGQAARRRIVDSPRRKA
jgi:hypothetical protein